MLKRKLRSLLISLLIVASLTGISASKSHYDVFKDEFKVAFEQKHGRKPDLKITFSEDGNAEINSDYLDYIDAMRTVLEDMEIKGKFPLDVYIYGDAGLGTHEGADLKGGLRGEIKIF